MEGRQKFERKGGGLVDPVEEADDQNDIPDMEGMDINKVNEISLKPIPPETARRTMPFDGYPFKKFKVGKANTYQHCIVALNPTTLLHQDPANRKVRQADGKMKKVRTWHSRVIRDRELNENIHIPFDREIEIKGIKYDCAIVDSHNVRAQICFQFNTNTQRIEVDRRYLLIDIGQRNKLKQVFEQVINPNLKMQKEAAFIMGETQDDAGGEAELSAM